MKYLLIIIILNSYILFISRSTGQLRIISGFRCCSRYKWYSSCCWCGNHTASGASISCYIKRGFMFQYVKIKMVRARERLVTEPASEGFLPSVSSIMPSQLV